MSDSVIIVGGSMAGLCAGALLARQGMQVTILERSREDLSGRGAGIAIHRELFDVLTALDIDAGNAVGVHAAGRQVFNADGEVVARLEQPQVFTSWGLVYRMLRSTLEGARYLKGKAVDGVRQHGATATVCCTDGEQFESDWVIAADGSRSALRAQLLPTLQPEYAGYVAWRGLVLEDALDGRTRAALEHRMSFVLPPGEHMLCYLVAGPGDDLRPGHRWYNWVWYRPVAAGAPLADLLTDADGNHHADGIPPQRIRDVHIATLQEAAARLLPPVLRAVVAATPRPFLQSIVDAAAPRLWHGRTFLVGDAASTARPHVGLGVSKAAGDALSLSRALVSTGATQTDALARWDAERVSVGHAALDWGRRLGSYIGPPPADTACAARARHYRDPDVVMREVACPQPERFLKPSKT